MEDEYHILFVCKAYEDLGNRILDGRRYTYLADENVYYLKSLGIPFIIHSIVKMFFYLLAKQDSLSTL